jgi:hypothetical protein
VLPERVGQISFRVVNFITRSVISLYTAALRTRSSCCLRISIGFGAALPDSDFIADLGAWSWLSFHADCAAKIFRYGSCRDGVKRTVESLALTNDDNGSELFEAMPD